MKFKELLEEFLGYLKYSIKKRTWLNYSQSIRYYIDEDIGDSDLSELTSNKLNDFLLSKYKGYSERGTLACSTLKIVKTIINQSLSYAYLKGYVDKIIKSTASFKQKSVLKVESLTDSEVRKIEKYILENKKFYSYGILLSLHTGLRIGELLALKWSDVDFINKVMSINATACDIAYEKHMHHIEGTPKSESSLRQIPLTNETLELLNELRLYQKNNSEYVISKPSGKQIFIRSYQDSFERLLKKLKIRHYGFHSLRHTFATRCYKHGMDVKTLSELLGHSNPSITLKIYVHTDLDTKREALYQITKKIKRKIA